MVLKHLKVGQRSFRGHFSSFSPASCVLLDYKTIPLPLTSLLPSPSRNIRIWRQTFPSLLLLVPRFIMGRHKSTGSHAWRLSWIEVISDLCHIFYGIPFLLCFFFFTLKLLRNCYTRRTNESLSILDIRPDYISLISRDKFCKICFRFFLLNLNNFDSIEKSGKTKEQTSDDGSKERAYVRAERETGFERILHRIPECRLQLRNEIRKVFYSWRRSKQSIWSNLLSMGLAFLHGVQSPLQVWSKIREVSRCSSLIS